MTLNQYLLQHLPKDKNLEIGCDHCVCENICSEGYLNKINYVECSATNCNVTNCSNRWSTNERQWMIKVCVPVPEGNKGTGLKATVEIPKGSVIGPHVGKAKSQSQGSYLMSYG